MKTDAEIVEMLEALRAPSTEADGFIAEALGRRISEIMRPYTSSIDAARLTVPRPAGSMSVATTFAVGGFGDARPHGAWAKVYHDTSMAGAPYEPPPFEAKDCPNQAIALCIAAFKARQIGHR